MQPSTLNKRQRHLRKAVFVLSFLLLCSTPLSSLATKGQKRHSNLEENYRYPLIQKLGIITAKNVFHVAGLDGYIVNLRSQVYGDIQNKAIRQEAAIRGRADALARETRMRRNQGQYTDSPSVVRDRHLRNNLGSISSGYTAEDVRLVMNLYTQQIRTMEKLLRQPRYYNHQQAIYSLMPAILLGPYNRHLLEVFGFNPAAPLKHLTPTTEEENQFATYYGQDLLTQAKSIEKEWFSGAWGVYHGIKALAATDSRLHQQAEKELVRLRPIHRKRMINFFWQEVEKNHKKEDYSMMSSYLDQLKKLTPDDERISKLFAEIELIQREKKNERLFANGPPPRLSGDYVDLEANSYTIVQEGDSNQFNLFAEGTVPAEVAEGVIFGRKVTLTWKGPTAETKEILWINGLDANNMVISLGSDDSRKLLNIQFQFRDRKELFKRPKSLGSRTLGYRSVPVEAHIEDHKNTYSKALRDQSFSKKTTSPKKIVNGKEGDSNKKPKRPLTQDNNNIPIAPISDGLIAHYQFESSKGKQASLKNLQRFNGKTLLPSNSVVLMDLFGSQFARKKIINVKNKSFNKAIEIRTFKKPRNKWDAQLSLKVNRSVSKGDVLLAIFYAKGIKSSHSSGETYSEFIFEKASPPWTKSTTYSFTLKKDWEKFYVPFICTENYSAGKAMVNFRGGYSPQTIQIAGLELLNFQKTLPLEDLEQKYN